MNVVIDTNVLVSAMLSPGRKAYGIIQSVIFGDFQLIYDFRIMDEYVQVSTTTLESHQTESH